MNKASICLNMIVKNESSVIESALSNVLSKIDIDYWVISDTGSTDGTPEIITSFFKKRGIKGELHADDWQDFSHNRNLALSRAIGKAHYILFFDADDCIRGELELPASLDCDAYALKFGPSPAYYRPLLVKSTVPWEWKGVLHEFLTRTDEQSMAAQHVGGSYHIAHNGQPHKGARSRQADKFANDAKILSSAFYEEQTRNPDLATRYCFYCAQSYRDAGAIDNAITWYLTRTKRGGWVEEVYDSFLNAGLLLKKIGDHSAAIQSFLDGQNALSARAECYYELAKLFREQGKHRLAFDFASTAKKIKKPTDGLFLREDVYDYQIDFELGVSAFYVEETKVGRDACEAVIASGYKNAETEQATRNLEFYGK